MITIISGTHRPNSNSLKTAKAYSHLMDEMGVDNQVLDLEKLPRQFMWDDMFGNKTDEGQALISKYIDSADRLLIVVPEYNGSYPGIVKLLFDAIDPAKMLGKKAALTGIASGIFGNQRGLDDLTMVLHHVKVDVVPWKVLIPAIYAAFDENGDFNDEKLLDRVKHQLESLLK